jgi:hypothetical protein
MKKKQSQKDSQGEKTIEITVKAVNFPVFRAYFIKDVDF